ncbi:hypothetical protein GCM10010377_43570 [Streptomyces viridiviolaceus]|uniref:Integral membrane protein n=1 Tax=Streptomyces viridiviolaceus TaxID=68282 RepID=A0ABW2EI01_9ACTN|nr:hypothetical protein [Streptomyces viridiviolaceus]GHB48014.1 hypothetical protein GCM10010377_43570 [Streptomyces viridiviolaceus]
MTSTVVTHRTRTGRPVPRSVTVASWTVPVMVVGQFALVAALPVGIAPAGALRHVHDRAVRGAATLLAVSYAVPLVVWVTRPDGAQSLSKDMHPALAGLIVAASAALVVTIHRTRARSRAAR